MDKPNETNTFEKLEKSKTAFFDTLPKKTSLEPIYMFGKHSGAPWTKKQFDNNQLNPILANDLKSDNKTLKPNSKVKKQTLKNEVTKNETVSNKLVNEAENKISERSEPESNTNKKKNSFDLNLIQQENKIIDQNFGNF